MKILYVCTHNRCRSILSEAITRHLSDGDIQAFSAGSQPVGEVHPLSLKYLQEKGIETHGLKSKSWDAFSEQQPDLVITVCDSAANEACPLWMGNTLQLHWGLVDPSKLVGSEEEVRKAFYKVMDTIETRVRGLLALNLSELHPEQQVLALSKLVEEVS